MELTAIVSFDKNAEFVSYEFLTNLAEKSLSPPLFVSWKLDSILIQVIAIFITGISSFTISLL